MAQDSPLNRPKSIDSVDTDTGQTLGNYIQRERLKKQFTLEEVAEQTCIHIATLRAIESNNRSKMPAEVFSRGFIKLYAEFLGLDQQDIMDRYEREMAQADHDTVSSNDILTNEKLAESKSFLNSRNILFFLLILILAGLGYYFFFSQAPQMNYQTALQETINNENKRENVTENSDNIPVMPKAAVPAEKAVENFKEIPALDIEPLLFPEKTNHQEEKYVEDNGLAVEEIYSSPASNLMEPSQPVALLPEKTDEIKLHILFMERTWMQVALDDQPAQEYLFDADEKSSWLATEKINLLIGNPAGVRLFVNDKELSVSGKPGEPLRVSLPQDIANQ